LQKRKVNLGMLKESDSLRKNRFLYVICRISLKGIAKSKIECSKRIKKKDDLYLKYIDWQENNQEVALFTSYAYADLKIPKKFDCIFDFKNPEKFCKSKMILTQSIWESYYPIDSLEDGHKHIAIFRFEDKIPDIIEKLPQEDEAFSGISENLLILGVCQFTDYLMIKKNLP